MVYHGTNVAPENHGTIYHRITGGDTKVKCTMVFGVVHMYHGYQLYYDTTIVQLYHPKMYHGCWGGTFVPW
jgi:hypothetical protein